MDKPIYKEGDPSKHCRPDASEDEAETGEITIGYAGDAPAAARESHEATITSRGEVFAAAMSKLTFGSLGDEADEGEADAGSDCEIATQPPWSPISSVEHPQQLPATAYSAQAPEYGFILPATTYSPAPKQQGDQVFATGYPAKSSQSDFMLPATTYKPVSKQQVSRVPATTALARAQATEPDFMLPTTTYIPASNQRVRPIPTVGASTRRAYQQLPATTYTPAPEEQGPDAPLTAYSSQAQARGSGYMLPTTTFAPASKQQQLQPAPARHAPPTQEPGQEIVVSRFPCISKEEGAKILANAYTAHALGPDFMLPRNTYSPVSQQQRPRATGPAYVHHAPKQQSYQTPVAPSTQRSVLQLPAREYCPAAVNSGHMLPASTYAPPAQRQYPAQAPVNASSSFAQHSDPQIQATRYSPATPRHEGSHIPARVDPSSTHRHGTQQPTASYAAALQSGLRSPAPAYTPAPSMTPRAPLAAAAGTPPAQVHRQQVPATAYVPSALRHQVPQRPATAASFPAQNVGQNMQGPAHSPVTMQQREVQYPVTEYSAPALMQQGYHRPRAAPSFSSPRQAGPQFPVTPYATPKSRLPRSPLSPTATPFSPGHAVQKLPSSTYRPFVLNDSGIPVSATAQRYDAQNQPGRGQSPQADNSPYGFKKPSKLSPTARSFCTRIGASYSLPAPKQAGLQVSKSTPSASTSKQPEIQLLPKIPAPNFSNGSLNKSDIKDQEDHSSASTSQEPDPNPLAGFYNPGSAIQQQTTAASTSYSPAPYNPSTDPASSFDATEFRRRSYDLRINTATIEFTNVTYSYKNTDEGAALRDLSLHIKDGENVAIVGLTGAGKTTLLKLLMGYKNNYKGCIKIDGVDIRGVSRESLAKQIAVVPQSVIVLDGSIWDNVCYGVQASREKVIEVCHVVDLHDRIMGLRNGYDTRLGVEGTEVSRSFLARLGIARLLLQDPKIVLLDACFRHLGRKVEYSIISYLRKWCAGRTVITVAHRVGIVTFSDRVYVMIRGILVQTGTHSELFHVDGLYQKLWIKKRIV